MASDASHYPEPDPDRAAPLEPDDIRFNRGELEAIQQLVAAAAGLSDGPRTWAEVAAEFFRGEVSRTRFWELALQRAGTWWTYQGRYYVIVPDEAGSTSVLTLTPPAPGPSNKNPDATGNSQPQGEA